MSDDNENTYKVSSLNGRLSVALSELHASDRSNILHTLLSDKSFYDAVEAMSLDLGLRIPFKKLEEEFIDAHIISKVLEKARVKLDTNDNEFMRDIKARRWFNQKLKTLLNDFGVPLKYSALVREYMVLGDVNGISYTDDIIVSLNEDTKSLILELSPSLSLADFKKQLPRVFSYWNLQRGDVVKPKHFSAKYDALLSREKDSKSYGQLAAQYSPDEASVKKRVQRIRQKRTRLLSDIT